jgi:hypothetical protein
VHISVSENQTYVRNLMVTLEEMLGVVRVVTSNMFVIEKAGHISFLMGKILKKSLTEKRARTKNSMSNVHMTLA